MFQGKARNHNLHKMKIKIVTLNKIRIQFQVPVLSLNKIWILLQIPPCPLKVALTTRYKDSGMALLNIL